MLFRSLLALEAGFRHLDPQYRRIPGSLTHTEHHRKLVSVIFQSNNSEAIADLLHAWTSIGRSHGPAHKLLRICTGHLVDLHNRVDFSSRLRRLVIRSVELIGHEGFKEGGMERFIELLNNLDVGVEDMDSYFKWALILLATVQSSEGARGLSTHSWELLAEFTALHPWAFGEAGFRSTESVPELGEERQELSSASSPLTFVYDIMRWGAKG